MNRRIPTEYELGSADLHCNYPMRFELPDGNPVVAWYHCYREGSPLQAHDWAGFSDPRRTTYRDYTGLRDGREDVVDGLLREVDGTGYDASLNREWWSSTSGTLREPRHKAPNRPAGE